MLTPPVGDLVSLILIDIFDLADFLLGPVAGTVATSLAFTHQMPVTPTLFSLPLVVTQKNVFTEVPWRVE